MLVPGREDPAFSLLSIPALDQRRQEQLAEEDRTPSLFCFGRWVEVASGVPVDVIPAHAEDLSRPQAPIQNRKQDVSQRLLADWQDQELFWFLDHAVPAELLHQLEAGNVFLQRYGTISEHAGVREIK